MTSFGPAMSINQCPQLPQLIVRTLSPGSTRGWLCYGSFLWPCALGRSGIRAQKREGDGATPRGQFVIREVYFRPGPVRRFKTATGLNGLTPAMGWCDAIADRNYNRQVTLPYPASTERLWRDDGLYDLVIVLGHNDRPRVRGRGSAIFIHVARPGFSPTEGCIALERRHLIMLLSHMRPLARRQRVLIA
jgi:L,D-peptidoglycan transpeptidase YkuD (ErfK/YbiS/YcfS/YnhG family)